MTPTATGCRGRSARRGRRWARATRRWWSRPSPRAASASDAYVSFQNAFLAKVGKSPAEDAYAAFAYDALYAVAIALSFQRGQPPSGALVSQGLQRVAGGTDADLTTIGQQTFL